MPDEKGETGMFVYDDDEVQVGSGATDAQLCHRRSLSVTVTPEEKFGNTRWRLAKASSSSAEFSTLEPPSTDCPLPMSPANRSTNSILRRGRCEGAK